jgi:hypothetical protein
MYYILERGGEKIMKKRWFVVILTIGLLLHVLPLSVLALSPDPTITDSDGTLLGWSDLSTVSDVLDDSREQQLAVVDADNDEEAADDRSAGNLTPKTLDEESGDEESDDEESGDEESGGEESDDEESDDDDPADADRDEATDDRPTVNLTPKIPDEESDDDGSADDDGSTTTPPVCKIDKIDDTYYYSTLDDAITAATDGDQIDLLKDIEWYTGLEFHSKKNLTISGGNTYTLTLNQNGMYASHSDITFKDLTLNIYAHTHTHEGGAGGTANLISNSNLRLNNVNFTLIPDGNCGSGIYLYQKSNLYLDGSYAVIRNVSNHRASGIYADDSEFKGQPNREIKINNSYLEITGCAHAAMTIDPIDITLSSSNVVVMDNGKSDSDGYGFGIGCYDGKLTMESSTLTATGNTGAWYGYAVFVDGLDVDSGSTLDIRNNGGSGLGVGGIGVIQGGSQVICDGNGTNDPGYGSGGLYVYAGGGDLTIESGANVSVCQNKGLAAIVNSCKLHIQNDANVSVDNNAKLGIYNSYDSDLTIESGANVTANHNGAHGIYNQETGNLKQGAFLIESGANVTANYNTVSGIFNCNLFTVEKGANLQVEYNSNCGIQNDEHATLNLLAGSVRYNHAGNQGGGLCNKGTAILSDDVELYNNHARLSGDDIYNADGATITFGPTGKGWALDGDPDCYDFITGWYDDYETTRWNAHGDEADLHMVLVAPVASYTGPLSLKAAHGSTGSLTVCKETVGELLPSDYDTVFTFELTLDDDAITTIDDQWCGVPFKNGKASFTLKSGESITLSNLPAGIGYTITETAQDGWTLLNLNPAETGVVPQNNTAKVVFTNLKNSPDDPYVPVVPVDPETPETPEIPEEPEGPETPEEPEEPEIPEETEETEAPGELPAEEPAQTDTSASLAQPEETPTQNTTTVTLIQTGTTDWLAAVLLIFGIGLLVCGWFFDRKQRAAKH